MGGTEAFPDLGKHCQQSDCRQLDFLPFTCDGCHEVFCLDHRSYKSHDCPKSDNNSRRVIICETCSTAIEVTGRDGDDEKLIMEKHSKSRDCNPAKKKKPTCPVRRCKEILTFSNTSTCKNCQLTVCLKHRFPADHACKNQTAKASSRNDKFLLAFASRNGKDCANHAGRRTTTSSPSTPSVRAY